MKRVLATLCAVATVICMAGCTTENNTPASTQTDPTEEEFEEVAQYDENTPLFVCQDRSDIEGDRNSLYYYNYKGDLLENAVMPNTGFFGTRDLAPGLDPSTGKIGYVDKSGVFVIEPQWDDATAFSDDGIALVMMDEEDEDGFSVEKYGYINEQGEQIIECIYDDATSFYPQGLAIVGVKEEIDPPQTNDGTAGIYPTTVTMYGVIDKTGKTIIAPQYKYIYNIEGDYILCRSEKAQALYDLSGKAIITEEECEKNQYYFEQECGTLYRWKREILSEEETEKNNGYPFHNSDYRIFDGKEFVSVEYNLEKPFIYSKRVATTVTGNGYGVVTMTGSQQEGNLAETVLIPYEYDRIVEHGSYYVAIKYKDSEGTEQSFDIYNSDFVKTAENINYQFMQYRNSMYGTYRILPDGYFEISYYDSDIGDTVCGIINEYGETIVPMLFYRPIKLFVYECIGGKFMNE